jgi:hypothetical protein
MPFEQTLAIRENESSSDGSLVATQLRVDADWITALSLIPNIFKYNRN